MKYRAMLRVLVLAMTVGLTACGQPAVDESTLIERGRDCEPTPLFGEIRSEAMAAFRGGDPDLLAASIVDWLRERGVAATVDVTGPSCRPLEARIFDLGEWTVVLWPHDFLFEDVDATRDVAAGLGLDAAAVHHLHADYWVHVAFSGDETLDRFASVPDYWVNAPANIRDKRRRWRGDAVAVARFYRVPYERVRPYFEHVPYGSSSTRRALPHDEFPLADGRVLHDFWRSVGIDGAPRSTPDAIVRVGRDVLDRLSSETDM